MLKYENFEDNDAAYILSRLLAEDYRSQEGPGEPGELPDYTYYQYGQPAMQDPEQFSVENYQNTHEVDDPPPPRAPQQEELEFPALLPQQKQFAVNPSSAEFSKNNPDFLQYRLEAMEDPRNHPEVQSDDDFQKQLVEVLDSMRESEPESEPGPDKRGMIGEPRAVPVLSSYRDEDSSDDDIFFTCTYSSAFT